MKDGTVKIGDFGLAKSLEASIGRSGQVGSLFYMRQKL
jgi:serine/threonine protein kinase